MFNRKSRSCAVVLSLALAVLVVFDVRTAAGQETPAPMTVIVQGPAEGGEVTLADLTLGAIRIAAEDVECTSAPVDEDASSVTLTVGTSEQSAVCAIEGVTLTVIRGDGQELFEPLLFEPGAEVVYDNLAPLPPGATGPDASAIVRDVPAEPGVHLTVWLSGSTGDAAAALPALESVWTAVEGRFVGFVVGAPAFANEEFLALYPKGLLPRDTLVALAVGRPGLDSCAVEELQGDAYAFGFETARLAVDNFLNDIGLGGETAEETVSPSLVTWTTIDEGAAVGAFVTERLTGAGWVVTSGRWCTDEI